MSGYAAKKTFSLDLYKPARTLFVHISLLHPDKEVLHGLLEFSIILMGKMTIMCTLFSSRKSRYTDKEEKRLYVQRRTFDL